MSDAPTTRLSKISRISSTRRRTGSSGSETPEDAAAVHSSSRRWRKAGSKFLRSVRIKKKKDVSFSNDAFFLAQDEADEAGASANGAGYMDQMTPEQIAVLKERLEAEEKEEDAKQLRRASIELAAETIVEVDREGIRGWRRDPDGLKMVRDEDSGLDVSEWEDHEWPVEAPAAPAAGTAETKRKGKGAAALPPAPKGAGRAASDMLMSTEARLAIMALVRDQGLSVDEAMTLVEKQERELHQKGVELVEEKIAELPNAEKAMPILRKMDSDLFHKLEDKEEPPGDKRPSASLLQAAMAQLSEETATGGGGEADTPAESPMDVSFPPPAAVPLAAADGGDDGAPPGRINSRPGAKKSRGSFKLLDSVLSGLTAGVAADLTASDPTAATDPTAAGPSAAADPTALDPTVTVAPSAASPEPESTGVKFPPPAPPSAEALDPTAPETASFDI